MGIRVIETRPENALQAQGRGLVRAVVAGAGLSGGMIAAMTPEWGLDVVDYDQAGSAQTLVPTLTRPGANQAILAQDYRREHVPWSPPGLAVAAEVQALGDGYWMALARAGGVVIAATDSVATQVWLAGMARRHGLGLIATGLGTGEVEVLVSPPGAPSYCCLSRDTAAEPTPCLLRDLPVQPLNDPAPPPTNSSLHLAALAAAVAVEEAQALAAGERADAELISCAPGAQTLRARVPTRADCRACADTRRLPEDIVPLELSTSNLFGDLLDAVGGERGWMVRVPKATNVTACLSCGAVTKLPRFVVLGRRFRCGRCRSDALVAVSGLAQYAWVLLDEIAAHSPLELGWPYWPVLALRLNRTDRHVELAGDARDDGVIAVEPLKIGR